MKPLLQLHHLIYFVVILIITAVPLFTSASLSTTDSTVLIVTIASTSTPPSPSPSPSPSGGGGGGGGGTGGNPTVTTAVIFQGLAYPGSYVNLIRDGQFVAKIPASPDAKFEISINNVTEGSYTYGIWAQDSRGVRSITHTFTVSITTGVTTIISGIFLPPTISVDKSEVKQGDPITVLGETVPNATVNVAFHSNDLMKNTTSDKDGLWKYVLDSLELDQGNHTTGARTKTATDISAMSPFIGFLVGDKNVDASNNATCLRVDLNCDGQVNLIDFSILAYWYKRPLDTAAKAKVDFNNDGKVDLVEFSIMAYYWTG